MTERAETEIQQSNLYSMVTSLQLAQIWSDSSQSAPTGAWQWQRAWATWSGAQGGGGVRGEGAARVSRVAVGRGAWAVGRRPA
jgi:hypothetical protein